MAISRKNMKQTDSKGNVLRDAAPANNAMKYYYWWTASEEEVGQQVQATIRFIAHHQTPRMEQLVVSTRLYGGSSAYNLLGAAFTRANSVATPLSQRMHYNLVQSVIDTLVSKMAKNKIIPQYLTQGGQWGMQQKAKKLSKFVEGIFYQNDVDKKRSEQFRDACVWGSGILHPFDDKGEVCVERVVPHELYIDTIESLVTQNPRQLHRVRIVERETLAAQYPDKIDIIAKAGPANYQDIGSAGTAADLVTITESWHLDSGLEEKDGMYLKCLGDDVLEKKEYDKDYFPFVFDHYSKKLLGPWGQGLAEQLQNIQGELNRLLILVQRSLWLGGSFKVLLENGSKVVSQHINNDIGAIIHYTGTPPQYITPPVIQREIYQHIQFLIDKGYQQAGISQMSAASQKPIGLNSGRAIREADNIEADRFLATAQEEERVTLELARQCIEVAKDIYSYKKSYSVIFPDTKFTETIDWKDIKLKESEYVMKCFPTSSLPEDPAGRLETVTELMQAGIIQPRTGRRLLDFPDLQAQEDLANAPEDLVNKILEKILNDGEYTAPEPFFDLQLCKQNALMYYNAACFYEMEEEKLEMLRKFMRQVDDLLGVNNLPAPMAPGAQPQAVPQAPPQSPMLPNGPQGGSQS